MNSCEWPQVDAGATLVKKPLSTGLECERVRCGGLLFVVVLQTPSVE